MMAKRGMTVEAIHFESAPYTSRMALEKVLRLYRILSAYNNDELIVHIVSLTHIRESLCARLRGGLLHAPSPALYDGNRRPRRGYVPLRLLYHRRKPRTGGVPNRRSPQRHRSARLPPSFAPASGWIRRKSWKSPAVSAPSIPPSNPFEDCCTVFTPPPSPYPPRPPKSSTRKPASTSPPLSPKPSPVCTASSFARSGNCILKRGGAAQGTLERVPGPPELFPILL